MFVRRRGDPGVILVLMSLPFLDRPITRRAPCGVAFVVAVLLGAGCGGDHAPPGAVTPAAVEAGDTPAAGAPDRAAIEASLAAADEYFNTQEIEKAEIILDRLIDRAPAEGRAHELLGQVLTVRAARSAAAGDVETARDLRREAYEHYRRAVEIGPVTAGLHQSAGTIAMMAGESAAALMHFEAAATLDPVNPQHPLYAAQLLIADEEFEAARARLERVLVLDPDEPLAYASLAIVALGEGHTDDALAAIARARTLAPNDVRFRVQEARILRRSGRTDRAVEGLLALGESEWSDDAVAAELAEGFAALDRYADAARVWMRRFRTREVTTASYLDAARAGDALRRAGDLDGARRWLTEAAVLAPDAPEVRALAEALD